MKLLIELIGWLGIFPGIFPPDASAEPIGRPSSSDADRRIPSACAGGAGLGGVVGAESPFGASLPAGAAESATASSWHTGIGSQSCLSVGRAGARARAGSSVNTHRNTALQFHKGNTNATRSVLQV
eukprot:973420-Prorocentrum_minimum.AAC.1